MLDVYNNVEDTDVGKIENKSINIENIEYLNYSLHEYCPFK